MRYKIVPIFLSLAMTLFSLAAHGKGVNTSTGVVFLPFDAKNAGNYAVLKDGLRVMLTSRLALKKDIVPLENTLSAEEQEQFLRSSSSENKELFSKLDADFIATGTMKAQDKVLLLQLNFYSVDNTSPVSVTMRAENEHQILGAIDVLSQRVAEKVFGYKPVSTVETIKVSNQAGIEAFKTEHPDRKYKKEVVSGSAVVGSESNVSIARDDLVRRKSELPAGMVSMAVGDGDGDGRNEIFVASEKDLRVYHYEGGILAQQDVWVFKPILKVQGINVVDMDGDGNVEIYLSAMDDEQDNFSSTILKWSPAAGIKQEIKNIRWSIRPLSIKGEGLVLAGQAGAGNSDSVLSPGIYTLKMDSASKKYSRGRRLFLPNNLNLFDFVIADIDGDGSEEKVAITSAMKMAVYDQENSLVWLSEADYGGSVNYLGKRWRGREGSAPGSAYAGDDEHLQDLQYVPTRLVAMDINNDGKIDIVSAKNSLSSFRMLSNLRSFSGGKVVCVGWNGSKMVELWGTDTLGGHIADLAFLGDIDSVYGRIGGDDADGINKVKLYVGQIPSDSFANLISVSSGKANLIVYDFNIIDKSKILSVDKQ